MAEVIHLKGLGTEPMGVTYIEPGTSIRDLVKQLGGTIRVEHVPGRPPKARELSPDVAKYIAGYQWEDSPSVLAVCRRYGWLDSEEFDTVEEAERWIESGEEWGEMAGEAIASLERIQVWD